MKASGRSKDIKAFDELNEAELSEEEEEEEDHETDFENESSSDEELQQNSDADEKVQKYLSTMSASADIVVPEYKYEEPTEVVLEAMENLRVCNEEEIVETPSGPSAKREKLTPEEILELRELYMSGQRQFNVASESINIDSKTIKKGQRRKERQQIPKKRKRVKGKDSAQNRIKKDIDQVIKQMR